MFPLELHSYGTSDETEMLANSVLQKSQIALLEIFGTVAEKDNSGGSDSDLSDV